MVIFISQVKKLTLAPNYADDEQLGQTDGDRLQALHYNIIQLICNIPGFYVLEFNYLLKFISNSQTNTCCTFVVICRHVQSSQIFESLDMHIPS